MIDADKDATDHILAGMLAELGLRGGCSHTRRRPRTKHSHRRIRSVSPEVEVTGASYLPFFDKGPGDHTMIDVTKSSVLGRNPAKRSSLVGGAEAERRGPLPLRHLSDSQHCSCLSSARCKCPPPFSAAPSFRNAGASERGVGMIVA